MERVPPYSNSLFQRQKEQYSFETSMVKQRLGQDSNPISSHSDLWLLFSVGYFKYGYFGYFDISYFVSSFFVS